MFSTPRGNAKYSWAKLDNEWLWTLSGFSLFKLSNSRCSLWNNKAATFKWWGRDYKHITSYNFQFCYAENVKLLSESALCRLQKSLKLSKRKSLLGLDDTADDGLNGFTC